MGEIAKGENGRRLRWRGFGWHLREVEIVIWNGKAQEVLQVTLGQLGPLEYQSWRWR